MTLHETKYLESGSVSYKVIGEDSKFYWVRIGEHQYMPIPKEPSQFNNFVMTYSPSNLFSGSAK